MALAEFLSGFIAGLAGLVAFVHTNFILQIAAYALPEGFSKPVFASALSFSKLVFELIPSIFFAVPATSMGIALLPSQKLILEGKGILALKTALGAFFQSGVYCVILVMPVIVLLPVANQAIAPVSGFALMALVSLAVFAKQRPIESAFAFGLSGALGIALFSNAIREPLFPLLSGLLGVPALLFALDEGQVPRQEEEEAKPTINKLVFAGTVAGAFSSLLPAMTPAFLIALIFLFFESESPTAVLQASSATLLSKTFFDFVAFYAIGKTRSGAVAFSGQELAFLPQLAAALAAGLAALFLAIALMLLLYRRFAAMKVFANKHAKLALLVFFAIASIAANGPIGLLVLGASASVGIAIALLGVNKSMTMGALLLPSIAYYFHAA